MTPKKHLCTVCGKAFRIADALAQHQTDEHGAPAALREKPKPEAVDPACIECGSIANLVTGKRIYPHRPDLHHKLFYLCQCGAYCGCHPNTTLPLGFPCGAATRKARSAAHAAFDPLWRQGSWSRAGAYQWLAARLGISPEDCHIGMMTQERALRVVQIVDEYQRVPA